MPPMTTTGDISYRTAGYFSKQLLERSQPLLVLDKFGQPKPLPAHSTRTIKFRGYEHLPNQPKALIEGVTPQASKPTFKDIEATINQYGDWIELTDVLADTHEDPLISEFSDILGEQAAIMRERITAGVVLGGTNVFFSGETAGAQATNRNGVNKPLTLELQRRVTRMLKRQLAMPITSFVSASPNFKTESVLPSYVAICHTDCEADIREMRGFLDVKDYGGGYKPMPGEIGSVEGVRYMCTTVFEASCRPPARAPTCIQSCTSPRTPSASFPSTVPPAGSLPSCRWFSIPMSRVAAILWGSAAASRGKCGTGPSFCMTCT